MTIIAVDIGGSGSRLRIRNERVREAAGPGLSVHDGGANHVEILHGLADSAIGVHGGVSTVVVSAAALLSFGDPDAIAECAVQRWAPRAVVVIPDAVSAVLAAWGVLGGAVVAAGTGAIGFGTDFRDAWVRVDGWGNLVGDAGSGAWIGARGLAAAMRAFDGRPDGSPQLLQAMRGQYGDPLRVPGFVRRSANEAGALAGFVPAVAAAARAKDPIAQRILIEAGEQLGATAAAALRDGVPTRAALVGGIAEVGGPLPSAFERSVRLHRPEALVIVSRSRPVDGAERFALDIASGLRPECHPPYVNVYGEDARITA